MTRNARAALQLKTQNSQALELKTQNLKLKGPGKGSDRVAVEYWQSVAP